MRRRDGTPADGILKRMGSAGVMVAALLATPAALAAAPTLPSAGSPHNRSLQTVTSLPTSSSVMPVLRAASSGVSAQPVAAKGQDVRLSVRLERMQAPDTTVPIRIRLESQNSSSFKRTPVFISGEFRIPGAKTAEAAARGFLSSLSQDYGIPDLGNVVTLVRTQSDNLGMSHLLFTLSHRGVKVVGSELRVHVDKQLQVRSLNGHLVPPSGDALEVKRTADEATALAIDAMQEELARPDRPKLAPVALTLSVRGTPELRWLMGRSSPDGQPHLAYDVRLGHWQVWIDATSGSLLRRTLLIDAVGIDTNTTDGDEYGYPILMASEEPYFRSSAIDAEEAAAHGDAVDYANYLWETFGRNSIDDQGYRLIQTVENGSYSNAYWDGYSTYFGTGWATRDIIGHEFTHGMTQFTAGLDYYGEPGALNESFSDVFGAMLDREDWLEGEDAAGITEDNPIRSLSDPHKDGRFHPEQSYNRETNSGQPDTYAELVTAYDPICGSTGDAYNECVHFNSGIQNHASYLMSEGGEKYGVAVYGVGREATERVFERLLTTRLTANADYLDARDNAIEACVELYGANSPECMAAQNAFAAVGLGTSVAYTDTDADGMVDAWENLHGLDPNVNDAAEDPDGDGLDNLAEYSAGTDPQLADTDGDGVSDGDEVNLGQDPRNAKDNVPVSRAGSDLRIGDDRAIRLDGSGSSDPNGDELRFHWRFVSVPTDSQVTDSLLSETAVIEFQPDVKGTYVLGLTVNDGKVNSLEDTVVVRIARTLLVPQDYQTIQSAIENAQDGDIVSVGPGVYLERLDFLGKDLAVTSTDGPEFTEIDAEYAGAGVSFISGEPLSATLSGFTIRHGYSDSGGAICIMGSQATVTDCVLEENFANSGGGIGLQSGNLELSNFILANNAAEDGLGGALYAEYSGTIRLVGNEFRGNRAFYDGGAVWVSASSAEIRNNLVRENDQGDYDSAALEIYEPTQASIINNTFVENGGYDASDVYLNLSGSELRNNIFGGSQRGATIYDYYGHGTTIAYNLFGTYADGHLASGDEPVGSNNNLGGDPQFVAYSNDGNSTNDDFTLLITSPAIDAGDPAEEYDDRDGTVNDMGYTGGPYGLDFTDSDGDGMSDVWEIRYGLDPDRDDSTEDPDGDGLTNIEEFALGINPSRVDSDGDGVDDGVEVNNGQNPRDPSDNQPVANAGQDALVEMGQTFEVEGTGSDPNGDALTFAWTLSNKPADSQLTDSNLQNLNDGRVRFTPDARGAFTLTLIVYDGRVYSRADSVVITSLGVLRVPSAFGTIQSAIDAAYPNERVLIAAGHYSENLRIYNPIVLEGEDGSDATTIDGNAYDTVIYVYTSGTVEIGGLSIVNGSGSYGGGLHLESSASLHDVQIRDNTAYYGGGLYAGYWVELTCESCTLDHNDSDYGAAAYFENVENVVLMDSEITDNYSSQSAAIYAYGGDIELVRTRLVANSGYFAGAISVQYGVLQIHSCLFQQNDALASDGVGAISMVYGSAEVGNNTFAGNWGLVNGDVHLEGVQEATFENNILAGGSAMAIYSTTDDNVVIRYNDVYGYRIRYGGALSEQTGINGNISSPALFKAYSRNGNFADDDFHLKAKSPSINAGSEEAADQDPDGSRNDMGMYGGPDATF